MSDFHRKLTPNVNIQDLTLTCYYLPRSKEHPHSIKTIIRIKTTDIFFINTSNQCPIYWVVGCCPHPPKSPKKAVIGLLGLPRRVTGSKGLLIKLTVPGTV